MLYSVDYVSAVTVCTTVVLFKLLMFTLESYCSVPASVTAWNKHEKWFNTISSLTHSCVSSIGCLACFYLDPNLTMKIQHGHLHLAYFTVCFSIGYFIHDFVHVILSRPLFVSWEILIHHVVVIFCFGISVIKLEFINYAIVSLLCEINSVFLHVRQLLNLSNTPRSSSIYRFNSLVNILTYIFFRICTLAWMVRWLVLHKGLIPDLLHKIGVFGMSIMTVINLILFARILGKDYLHRVSSSTTVLDTLKTK